MDKKISVEKFEAFIRKAFKVTDEEVASLYNEAGDLEDFSIIERKDADRVQKLSTDKQNQFNRGLKEGAGKLEKELKEKYEIESDLIGVELFDFIIENKLEGVKANPDDVMKHPDVTKLINSHGKEIKAIKKEYEDKLRNKEEEVNYSNFFAEVKGKGIAEFEALNPILSDDPKKAVSQKGILVRELEKFKYRKDGDSIIVLKEDGTNLVNEHGHPVSYQEHVKSIAESYFDFKAAEERSSTGNQNTQQKSSKKVRMPKDKAEYVEMMKDNALTPAERVEIMKLFTSKK